MVCIGREAADSACVDRFKYMATLCECVKCGAKIMGEEQVASPVYQRGAEGIFPCRSEKPAEMAIMVQSQETVVGDSHIKVAVVGDIDPIKRRP